MSIAAPLTAEHLEKQLDRLAAFYPRIDTKVSGVFAAISGQLAIVALNLGFSDVGLWYVVIPLMLFLLCVAYVLTYLFKCTYPHLEGGHSSVIYFAEIAKLREVEYIDKVSGMNVDGLAKDLAGQIWRNAQIICVKYVYVKQAIIGLCLSIFPWSLVLLGTSLVHSRMLSVGR